MTLQLNNVLIGVVLFLKITPILGGEKMFEIIEKKGKIVINLTAGDSAEIETQPFIDADNNKIFDPSSNDQPIILGDNDIVLFSVGSPSGKVYLKKILTNNDYNSNGVLTLKLTPDDTIDMQPFSYLFSFAYMPDVRSDCYTYATGTFNVLPAITTLNDV